MYQQLAEELVQPETRVLPALSQELVVPA